MSHTHTQGEGKREENNQIYSIYIMIDIVHKCTSNLSPPLWRLK